MRKLFLLMMSCIAGCNDAPSAAGKAPPSRPGAATRPGLVDELESLPIGLRVTHAPAEVSDPVGPDDRPGQWKYRWIFKTEVSAIDRPLTITQFGILAWDGARWILPPDQRQYNCGAMAPGTFAEWYACPDTVVAPGKSAIDPQNWAGSRQRADFQQKWFYIGTDADGKRYKGEGVVRLVARASDGTGAH